MAITVTVAVGSKQEIVLGHSARCEIIMTKENDEVSSFKDLMQICKNESSIILLLMHYHAFVSVA